MYPYGYSSVSPPPDVLSKKLFSQRFKEDEDLPPPPAIYSGILHIDGEPEDTFVKLDNWEKVILVMSIRILSMFVDPEANVQQ